jgi:hypothetical protein
MKQEESRRLNNLNPAEQFVFVMTKVISTNRYARWGFICYLAALHILVFTSLHQVMLTADCHHGTCASSSSLHEAILANARYELQNWPGPWLTRMI